jgi:ABC-2 type transport system ATP-binding protein
VRRQFLESMVDLAASGRTVFLSSHQIAEVERVADIVAILRQGKLIVVDTLEDLKSQVREVTITLSDDAATPPDVAGTILRQRRRARQWQLIVRNPSDTDLYGLRARPGIAEVEVRRPSLEDIFVAYMQSDAPCQQSQAPEVLAV